MIKIDNLTKTYKAKAKTVCKALDGISLTLPEKGLVFVLGKSGSGKSTLLNLIGGLDSFDIGNIVSFGNSLAGFKESDYEAYRSDFVSFIFQDYHLIDELTVNENITLFDSDGIDEDLLSRTLRTVGMEDYVDRYPTELSGGQKQRVAIARGILKNPRVVLCDEPTGNLDRKTSYQILELLKKLSYDKLVIVVSHNLTDAEAFADRIIELSDGRIVEDRTRDKNYEDGFAIEDGRAILPYHERMSDEDVDALNDAIRSGEVTEISLRKSGFEKSEIEYVAHKHDLKLRRLGRKNLFCLFKKFFFSKYRHAISTILISVLMFGLFSIVQSLTMFDAISELRASAANNGSVMAMQRSYNGFPKNIYEDLKVLDGEKTYPLYSQTIWTENSHGNSWDNVNRLPDANNFDSLYIHENYGLLLCDEEYIADLYGKNGEISLIAGSLDGAYDSGLLITDYFADSIIKHELDNGKYKYLTYESILGIFSPSGVNTAGKIVGIIDTDYEQKYEEIFDMAEEGLSDPGAIKREILENPLYMRFMDEVMLHLGVAYSLNPDYVTAFDLEETSLVKMHNYYFEANDVKILGANVGFVTTKAEPISPEDLADDEIGIPYEIYNELFDTDYTTQDANIMDHVEEKTVTLRKYINDDPKGTVLHEKTLRVTFVTAKRPVVSRNTMLYFKQSDWQPSRLYVKNPSNIEGIVKFSTDNDYTLVSREHRNMQRLDELITTFYDLFVLLEVVAIAMIAFYLTYYGMRSIKENSYQIGVIKALGGRTYDIAKIFVFKTFIIGVIIAVVSTFAAIGFISLADSVLVASIEEVIGLRVGDLSVIKVIPTVLTIDSLLMITIAFISALLPTISLRKIKPVDIIKTRE